MPFASKTIAMTEMVNHNDEHRAQYRESLLDVDPAILPNIHGNANGIASSIQISSRFVMGFGFSNGCDEFALYEPAAVLPDLLDGLLARDRTRRERSASARSRS